jgi:hypothetical protein
MEPDEGLRREAESIGKIVKNRKPDPRLGYAWISQGAVMVLRIKGEIVG